MQRSSRVSWCVVLYTLTAALWLSIASGCSTTIDETHYFRTTDKNGKAVNYFRTNIKANTFLLDEVRYISGFFDKEAVAEYFSGPISGNSGQNNGQTQGPGKPTDAGGQTHTQGADNLSAAPSQDATANTRVEMITGGEPRAGSAFLLIQSTQAEVVAEEIKGIAAAKEFGNHIALIANRDRLIEGKEAENAKTLWANRAQNIASIVGKYLEDDNYVTSGLGQTAAQRQSDMSEMATAMVQYLGEDETFPDLNALAAWLKQNRSRILEGR